MKEKIKLEKIGNRMYIEPKTNAEWVKFIIDYFAQEQEGTCFICGKKIKNSGFLCLDGGDEACYDCVEII